MREEARSARALLAEGLVDRLYWVQAPVWLGEGAVPAFPGIPAYPLAGCAALGRRWSAARWALIHYWFLDRQLCLPESLIAVGGIQDVKTA